MKKWELENLNKLNKFFEDIFGMLGIEFEIKNGNGLYIEDIVGNGFSIQVNPIYDCFETFKEEESNFYGFELFYDLFDKNGKSIIDNEDLPRIIPSANVIDLRKSYTKEQNAVNNVLSCLLNNKILMDRKMYTVYAQILDVELPKVKLTDAGLRRIYNSISKCSEFKNNDILMSKIQRIIDKNFNQGIGVKDFN